MVRICRRLDGLPLALELAAARTNVLTVHELADTLESELSILQTPGPGGDQELVDAMVGWTYQRLSPTEKLIFERLSVFGGSFGRDAVAEICGDGLDEVEVVDVLSSLVSKSLVARQDDGSPQARFRLLHLIRQYAASTFALHPDRVVTHRAPRGVLPLISPNERHRTSPVMINTSGCRHRPGAEQHAPSHGLGGRDAARSSPCGWWRRSGRWCYLRGRYTDGRRWAASALRAWPDAPSELLAPALELAGTLAFLQCDYADAKALAEQAQALFAETDDRAGVVWSIARLGSIARELGRYQESAGAAS